LVPAPNAPRILVVEDEPSIRQGLLDVLVFHGYGADFAADGATALRRIADSEFDLVVLDVMLPVLDGFSVCEQLRRTQPELPVLMLTAKNSEDDVLRGFEAGADDYVTKPFSIRQLLARVHALLKRTRKGKTDAFSVGPLEVDPERAALHAPDGDQELTQREIEMLRLLAEEPGRIVSRRVLLREVWGMQNVDQVETRTVDVHVGKLRKKLGRHGELLETVRGQGYRLCTRTR
ncbi:MAG TPA: response regulator transcription factor, partial [Polyangiaceae bacterium]|nr:response regulator transcription factor [Polyangiaceae bacterium]